MLGAVLVAVVLLLFHDEVWRIWTTDAELIELCNSILAVFVVTVSFVYLRFLLTVVSVSLGSLL